jgi:hypothetical protein
MAGYAVCRGHGAAPAVLLFDDYGDACEASWALADAEPGVAFFVRELGTREVIAVTVTPAQPLDPSEAF